MKIVTNRQLKEQQAAQAQQAAAVTGVLNEVAQLRAQLTPQGIITTLAEYDPRMLALLFDQIGSDVLVGGATWLSSFRKQAIQRMRLAVESGGTDIQITNAIRTWTNWGFGYGINIRSNDAVANAVWEECWQAPRNRPIFGARVLKDLSAQILTDGELFFIGHASRLDGEVTWRTLDALAVTDIIHPDDDPAVNVWYITTIDEKQVAIPDAFAYFALPDRLEKTTLPDGVIDINDTARAREGGGTFTVIIAAQRNRDRSGRGWPEFYRALAWSEVYAQMLKEYSAVFSAVAMYVDKLKIEGGQQTVDNVMAAIQSSLATTAGSYVDRNPRPAAGALWGENEKMSRERMPLGTAAGDAQSGTLILATQLATGLGVTLPDAGRPDAMQNQAVAKEAAKSPHQGWQRYQEFWTSLWQDVFETTLRLRAKFGNVKIADYAAEIAMTLPVDIDTDEVTMAMRALNESANAGTLGFDVAMRATLALVSLLLMDLGVKNVDELLRPPAPAQEDDAPVSAPLTESHVAVTVAHLCPLCGAAEAHSYAGHGPLLVCAGCGKTYNPEVE